MRNLFFTTAFLLLLAFTCFSQQNSAWGKWNQLIGTWQGEGKGEPGKGGGTFSFAFDLDKKIIVRKSHSEYPATADKPKIVHDDLMIIYLDVAQNPTKAVYFDNEGHIINYKITYTDSTIVLSSEKVGNAPIFRLTYEILDKKTINAKFEISPDGEKFATYIEGKCKKQNDRKNQ